jgi:hypothetical protein
VPKCGQRDQNIHVITPPQPPARQHPLRLLQSLTKRPARAAVYPSHTTALPYEIRNVFRPQATGFNAAAAFSASKFLALPVLVPVSLPEHLTLLSSCSRHAADLRNRNTSLPATVGSRPPLSLRPSPLCRRHTNSSPCATSVGSTPAAPAASRTPHMDRPAGHA